MSLLMAIPTDRRAARTRAVAGRWILGFVGFPLGGLVAMATVGAIDTSSTALAGGALTGLVLGAVQSVASPVLPRASWVAATAVGLASGLAIGATAVDFDTSLGALAAQGAICGAVLGLAQAAVLVRSTTLGRRWSACWVPFLAACWAIGWTITAAAGVDVERQYTVFGATGAIAVAALTTVLPLALRRRGV